MQRSAKTERADVGVPGAGKIVLGFIVAIAIGAGTIVMLRRVPQTFWRRESAAGSIRVLDRTNVSATMRVYLVQLEGTRVMIAEGRTAVGLIELPGSNTAEAKSAP